MIPLRIPGLVRLLFGIVLMAGVLLYYDAELAVRALGTTRWWLAGPAILGLVLIHLIGAATWRMLAKHLVDTRLAWRTAIAMHYAAQALGTVTPAAVGGDAYRVRAIHSGSVGWKRAVLPVVVQRATSFFALAALASVGLLLLPVTMPARIGVLAIPIVAMLAAGAIYLFRRPGEREHQNPSRSASSATARALLMSATFHLVAVLLSYVLVLAIHPGADPVASIAALVVARLAAFLPVTPAGLGVQEGALALLLPEAGMSPEAAVAVSVLMRVAMLATLCAGVLALSVAGRVHPGGQMARDVPSRTSTIHT